MENNNPSRKAGSMAFQGDIGFIRVDEHIEAKLKAKGIDVRKVISDAKNKILNPLAKTDRPQEAGFHPEKGMVLAQGESRNHYHAFREPEKVDVFATNDDNIRLVVMKDTQSLKHEEHDPIDFEKDEIYVQGFQFAYDYEEEYSVIAD